MNNQNSSNPNGPDVYRREYKVRGTVDAGGEQTEEFEEGSSTILDRDGAVTTINYEQENFYSGCACTRKAPPGGTCSICGRISCKQHFYRCSGCLRPLCARHVTLLTCGNKSKPEPFCSSCHGLRRTQQIAGSFFKTLLSPFVEFED